MRPSAKRLTLSVLLLLGPTVLVGWLGLQEIRRLEEKVADAISGGAAIHLRSAEQEFRALLEKEVEASLNGLDSRPYAAVQRALRNIARRRDGNGASGATLAGLLLDEKGQPRFPVVPRRRGSPEPNLVPQWSATLSPATSRLLVRIREAEWFAMLGDWQEGLGTLEAFAATGQIKAENQVASGRLAYERGRFRSKVGDLAGALRAFRLARQRLQTVASRQRTRSGLQALYLLSLVRAAEIETAMAHAEPDGGGVTGRDRRTRGMLDILEGISGGSFDGENDEWLQWMYDRIERLAEPYADSDDGLRMRLEDLRERNRDRVALRLLAQDVQALGLDFSADAPANRLDTFQYYETTPTSLLAFRPITVVVGRSPQRLWAGLHIDLGRLYKGLAAKIEGELSQTGRRYGIDLVDALGNSVIAGDEAPSGADRERIEKVTTRHPLGPPLLHFSLVAVPRDPARIESEARHSVLIKAMLLLALAVVAGAGAFVLVRTVRREAELANMKTEFVGRVSHELKTPLALIRMYGETLAMGRVEDPDKVAQFAGIVAKESDRLTGMIDNILDFSQIEAGTKVYAPVATRVDLHLRNIVRSYRPHLEEHGFLLTCRDLPPLVCHVDPEGLTQAIVNLLGNAQKYSPEDAVKEIEVRLQKHDGMAWIDVLDHGIGVPSGERGRVFDTFYRASTAGERRGAGLGLALVRHFAEHHGGRALHEPRPGGGSVFRITLPLDEEGGDETRDV